MTRDELIDRLEGRISRIKEKSTEIAESGMERIAEIGGGAAAGWADAEWGDETNGGKGKQILGFPIQQAAGATLAIGGVMGMFGKYSPQFAAAGGGMLAYEAGKATFDARKKKKQQQGAATAGVGGSSRALAAPQQHARVGARDVDQMLSRVQQGQ